MSKGKTISLIVGTLILAVIIFIAGWGIGFRNGMKAGGMTSSMAEMMLIQNHLTDQLANADCYGLKAAINDYMMIIEKHKDGNSPFITETTYWGDVMITHTRLSRIEKKIGNEASSQQHLQTALKACIKRGWKECSEDKLIEFTTRLEEKNPIACLSND